MLRFGHPRDVDEINACLLGDVCKAERTDRHGMSPVRTYRFHALFAGWVGRQWNVNPRFPIGRRERARYRKAERDRVNDQEHSRAGEGRGGIRLGLDADREPVADSHGGVFDTSADLPRFPNAEHCNTRAAQAEFVGGN